MSSEITWSKTVSDGSVESTVPVESKPGHFMGKGAWGKAELATVFLGKGNELKAVDLVKKQYPATMDEETLKELGEKYHALTAEPVTPTFGSFRIDFENKATYATDVTQGGRWSVVSMNELLHPQAAMVTFNKDPLALQRVAGLDVSGLADQLATILGSVATKNIWLSYFDVFFLLANDEGEARVIIGDLDTVTPLSHLHQDQETNHFIRDRNNNTAIEWLNSLIDSELLSPSQKLRIRTEVIPELESRMGILT